MSRPFFSFNVFGVLSSLKVFQWFFKKVLRMFEITRMFPVSFKGVYKKFQRWFDKVSGVFQVRLKGVSSNFKGDSRVFERSLIGVSGKFQ